MDSDLQSWDDSSLVLGKARKRYNDIVALEKASTDLFPNTFGDMIADDGIIMRRTVKSSNGEKIPFIEWLYHNIVVKANSTESLASEQRCFLLTGRAGQGKSTLCRKLFLHLKDQGEKIDDKIRPHYLEQYDAPINEFFSRIHAKTTYVQARSLSANNVRHKQDHTAKLIIIDGLDEISEEQIDGALDNIIQMIESQDEAIFLFSSRSRQHSGDGENETIYLNELKRKMKDANLNQSLDGQIVSVGDLTLSEKKTMFGLLNETVKERSPRLGRLVENDSDYLKRPADFHIMKNQAVKNGVQYYLETTRWLFRREMGKDDSERN
jgi:energy-coupling factor transporter ATP-binding protein EcfA2